MSDPSEYIIALARLADDRADVEVGGKASQLATLIRAGLPVPEGFVVSAEVAALDPDQRAPILEWIVRQAGVLGAPLAVRSSAAIEDRSFAAAPGVFASVLGVSPTDVIAAIQQVWASAATPLVRAYAEARGLAVVGAGGIAVPIAVIVQRQVIGPQYLRGALYTRMPGDPDSAEMLIESHASREQDRRDEERAPGSARIARASGVSEAGEAAPGLAAGAAALGLDRSALAELVAIGLRAEAAIGASRGADVEWVIGQPAAGDTSPRVWLVQARTIVHPVAPPPFPVALLAFSRAEPDVAWRLDVTHNPDPLSPAQAGLVERMDRLGLAPYRMRMVGGYLYYAAEPDLEDRPEADPSLTDGFLLQMFHEELVPAMESLLAAAESDGAGVLDVLEAYEQFYALYAGRLAPLIARGRRMLPAFLRAHLPPGMGSRSEEFVGRILADGSSARLETLLDEVAAGDGDIDRLVRVAGTMTTAWDIAASPLSETPAAIAHAVAHRREVARRPASHDSDEFVAWLRDKLSPGSEPQLDPLVALARAVRDMGEIDDRLYFRAQTALRRALLRQAKAWNAIDDHDVFFLPLDQVLEWIAHEHCPEPVMVHRMAQAARSMRTRQAAWRMPLYFSDGQATSPPGSGSSGGRARGPDRWAGRGTGGQVRGLAVRVDDLAVLSVREDLPEGAILVVATITPAMVFASSRASGIVAQHGGLLDHGAAMARELGLPCVVDCPGVWDDVHSGDQLWVDGDDGMVLRIADS